MRRINPRSLFASYNWQVVWIVYRGEYALVSYMCRRILYLYCDANIYGALFVWPASLDAESQVLFARHRAVRL